MKIHNSLIRMLPFLVALPSLSIASFVDTTTGYEWRSLYDTTNISWNDVKALGTDADGAFAPGSVINGVDFSGWYWAGANDVDVLFELLSSGNDPIGSFESKIFPGEPWLDAALSDHLQLGYTFGSDVVFGMQGITADLVQGDNTQAITGTILCETNVLFMCSSDMVSPVSVDVNDGTVGVYLYKDASSVPLPAAFPLFGTALGLFGWLGRKTLQSSRRT